MNFQPSDIERMRVFIQEASGRNNMVSEQSVLSYFKNILNKDDPEEYFTSLKEEGIVTDFGHGRIGFTGDEQDGKG